MTSTPAKKKKARRAGRDTKPRVRRTAEVAHEQILDAADKRLAALGPRGIRLQEIAADVGVSHPTILHHFGTREALVEAVCNRALESLQQKIVSVITADSYDSGKGIDVFAQIIGTLGDRGHARLMAWLALEGRPAEDPMKMLKVLAELMHQKRAEHGVKAPFEDTVFIILLVALALFGEGVLGDAMLDSAGLKEDPAAKDRFHAWLLQLVEKHLITPPVDP